MVISWTGRDLAVDLGTSCVRVYARGRGVLAQEPSAVAVEEGTTALVAVGEAAHELAGRAPDGIDVVAPLRDGVIADVECAEHLLRHVIGPVVGRRRRYVGRPRMLLTVPSGTSSLEQRAVKEVAYQAGARGVWLMEAPLAAALGAGLPIHQSTGHLVVDIGAATTEVAVIARGGIVASSCVRTAGSALDRALSAWVKREHGLLLGSATAEALKLAVGSAYPGLGEGSADVRGRDLSTGLPRTATILASEVRAAFDEPLNAIVDGVRATLDATPAELAGDLMDRGLVLTGAGALLRGLDARLSHETGVAVHVAEQPATAVVRGAGRCVEDLDVLQHVFIADRRRAA